LSFTLDT